MERVTLVATLAVLVSTATVSPEESQSNPVKLDVECDKAEQPKKITVTEPNTTLTVACPTTYTIQPAAGTKKTEQQQQQVYTDVNCELTAKLDTYCSGASATALDSLTYGLVFQFPKVPCEHEGFYLLCNPPLSPPLEKKDQKACKVHVLIGNAAQPGEGEGGPTTHPGGGQGSQEGPTGQGGTGGPAGVQICAHGSRSITISVPEKGSSVQFACESNYNLYPIEPNKVFSKDCKKQETLQDMTRTQVPAATAAPDSRTGSPPTSPTTVSTYTLKADKKPAKKTLCYLCAKERTTPDEPGTVENYCVIYVESGACTQSGLGFTLALVLPCILAVLRFM